MKDIRDLRSCKFTGYHLIREHWFSVEQRREMTNFDVLYKMWTRDG